MKIHNVKGDNFEKVLHIRKSSHFTPVFALCTPLSAPFANIDYLALSPPPLPPEFTLDTSDGIVECDLPHIFADCTEFAGPVADQPSGETVEPTWLFTPEQRDLVALQKGNHRPELEPYVLDLGQLPFQGDSHSPRDSRSPRVYQEMVQDCQQPQLKCQELLSVSPSLPQAHEVAIDITKPLISNDLASERRDCQVRLLVKKGVRELLIACLQIRNTTAAHLQLATHEWSRFVEKLMSMRKDFKTMRGACKVSFENEAAGDLSKSLLTYVSTMYKCAQFDTGVLEHYRDIHSRLVEQVSILGEAVKYMSSRQSSPASQEREIRDLAEFFANPSGDCFAHKLQLLTNRLARNLMNSNGGDLEKLMRGVGETLETATAALLFGAAQGLFAQDRRQQGP